MRLCISTLLFIFCVLFSQGTSVVYTLTGHVVDYQGEPITYAVVRLDNSKSTVTDNSGTFVLKLSAGEYKCAVSATGYKPKDVNVRVSKNTKIDIALEESNIVLDDVSVYGKSASKIVEDGVFSVKAIDITPNLNKMVTLNDLVDRTAGVKVRREGGAGSDTDLSINGMTGNSIRYFIDGVPLETKGTGLTLENVPLNMVERVELYKGVVPSELSSDALGGAVNIVTKKRHQNYLDASYGISSFATHTGEISGQYYIPGTVIAIRPTFNIISSKNNYLMKGVEVWSEEEDSYVITNKRRFHDDYFSLFGQLEVGVNDVKWADMFFVGASYNKIDKDIQTGAMQNKVYGEASRNSHSLSLSARYSKRWNRFATRFNLSHTNDYSETVDTAYRKYSWDGTWMTSSGNELNNKARTLRVYKRPLTVLNAGIDYSINDYHTIAFNYMYNRRGNDRHDEYDKTFEATNDVVNKHILSLTYLQSLVNNKLQLSYFVKDYINKLAIEQSDDYTITGSNTIDKNSCKSYWGGGIGGRYTFIAPLSVKASYEHSVRLPLSRELLGNGTTIYPNLTLSPETSNNYNIGVYGTKMYGMHQISYEVNGFIRHVQNYIRATVSEREGMMQYVNEPAIDVKGFDFDVSYLWNNKLQLSVNGSWTDSRNLRKYKTDGNPSATYKNRVPNRPWMFGNAEASYTFRNLVIRGGHLRVGAAYQYIHWYYLNWEAYGAASSKARIPTQNVVDLSLSYSWHSDRYNVSLACNNVFDELAYDNYMLQKPGRSFAAKFRIFIY